MDVRMPPAQHLTPRLVITEQPKQRGMRFRYLCEGRSAGSIPGENTSGDRKTWPSVQIHNYHGEVTIRVSLVSNDKPPRPHPHSLVGKDCSDGICKVRVTPDTQMTATFSNLGIQCVKRKEVADALKMRKSLMVDPFNTSNNNDPQAVDIDLNVVSLCFEAFINQGNYHIAIPPVLSKPIYDKKATCSAMLRICRVDRSFGSCKGGDEVYLLCDKVQKDDITICFYDVNSGWEAYGEFSPTDVHRQVAIVFRTPPYKDQNIGEATKVLFQLRRGSDQETSDSKEFTYLPLHHAQPNIRGLGVKRKVDDFNHSTKEQLSRHILTKAAKSDTGNLYDNNKIFTSEMPSMTFPTTIPPNLFSARMPTQPVAPFPETSGFLPNFHPRAMPTIRPNNTISHDHGQWRNPDAVTSQSVHSTQQQVPLQQQSYLSDLMAAGPTPPMSMQPLPHQQILQAPSQTMDVIDYDVTESSFKGINTDDLNESIKQLSIEPIDNPAIKHEPDQSGVRPYPRNPSEDNSTMYYPTDPPPYQIPDLNIQGPSPGPFSQVQSPPMTQHQVASPYSQVQSPVVGEPHLDIYNPNLQHIDHDVGEKLPSFDLASATFEYELMNPKSEAN